MIEPLARLGYASKAFIYAIVGLLAAAAALNRGGAVTDTRGALRVILSHPFGNILLFVLAVGLCGYGRLARARRVPRSRTARHRLHGPGHPDRPPDPRRWSTAASASRRSGWRAACARRTAPTRRSGCGRRRCWRCRWVTGWSALLGAITAAYGVSEIVAAIRDTDEEKKNLTLAGSGAPADPEPDLPLRRRRARPDHRRARHPAGARRLSARSRARPPAFADRSWSWPAPGRAAGCSPSSRSA